MTTSVPAEPGEFLYDLRRKRARRRKQAVGVGAVTTLLIVGGVALVQWQLSSSGDSKATIEINDVSEDSQSMAAAISANAVSASVLQANAELVADVRPTRGAPIDLLMLPSGVNLVIHLRPAELWSDDPEFAELRTALTQTVVNWIEQQLRATCRREPEQIEEAVIGLLLGPTGSTPEVAAVVRLKEPAKLSDLVEEFRGEPVLPDTGLRLFRGAAHAHFIRDEQTLAVCPADLAEDLADWTETPNYYTTDGILQLLSKTDRARLFTVVGELEDVRRHADWLFTEAARPAADQILGLFGEESETVCWSVHLGDELHSELHVRTRVAGVDEILGPRGLAELLSARITDAPRQLLDRVRRLDPRHTGARQLIGRLPAMAEAARRATVVTTGDRHVQLTTLLPAKAAPNLTLATLLASNETLRAIDAVGESALATSNASRLPQTVAERLKLPIDAEFRRTPLRDALAYLCNEIDVKLEIDGDALKDAGYTQNMPQSFNIGVVPIEIALSRIVSRYDGDGKAELQMVAVVDEAAHALRVMTRKFADQRGLTPLDLPPSPE